MKIEDIFVINSVEEVVKIHKQCMERYGQKEEASVMPFDVFSKTIPQADWSVGWILSIGDHSVWIKMAKLPVPLDVHASFMANTKPVNT